jgi:hypothetical protein
MLVPLAAIWVPPAIGVAVALGILALVMWRQWFGMGSDGTEGPDSDGGGGWRRRRPRRPPPGGPVSWVDFERQFAAYVESRSASAADRRAPTREPERTANAGRHPRRGG